MTPLWKIVLLCGLLFSGGCTHHPEAAPDPPFYSLTLSSANDTYFFKATIQKKPTQEVLVTFKHPRDLTKPRNLTSSLTEGEWQRFESAFSSQGFWRMPEHAQPYALDGSAWILEASNEGAAKTVIRINPEGAAEEKKFMKLANMFLDLENRHRPAQRR